MASLQKITYTYWIVAGKRVPAGTPGAVKVQEESRKWYGVWREGRKLKKVPLSTDRDVAQAMLGDLLRNRELGRANMLDPRKDHLERGIEGHVAEYLAHHRMEGRAAKYMSELKRILGVILTTSKIETLADLTGDKINAYLAEMDAAAATKKKHLTTINAFARWCERKDRIERNPLARVTSPGGEEVRPRRALTEDEVRRLLEAARRRPLSDVEVNRGGRGNKGGTVAHAANVRDEVKKRLLLRGRERNLLYKLVIFTGLRKNEIANLRVRHLELDGPLPTYELPGKYTKSRRATNAKPAKGVLLPEFAAELRAFIADSGRKPKDVLFVIPDKLNQVFKNDLKAAGIPERDEEGRYATFHSLRHSANTLLGIAKVPTRLRMLFMRHTDIRLTMQRYDDEAFQDLSQVVEAFARLGLP
jgi:integrase